MQKKKKKKAHPTASQSSSFCFFLPSPHFAVGSLGLWLFMQDQGTGGKKEKEGKLFFPEEEEEENDKGEGKEGRKMTV